MRVAALFSGGKDSTYAVYLTQKEGLEVTYLVTLQSEQSDSYMFHSINIHLADLLSEAMNIPLLKKTTKGKKEEELADLRNILQDLKIDGVVSGAIASDYQRTRIQTICDELGLESITPLWHKDQQSIVQDQLQAGFRIMIVGVFAEGFTETWLGRIIDEKTIHDLMSLHKKYKINIAGEGGEYETLVIDGPLFEKKLIIDESYKEWNRDTGILLIKKAHLEKH